MSIVDILYARHGHSVQPDRHFLVHHRRGEAQIAQWPIEFSWKQAPVFRPNPQRVWCLHLGPVRAFGDGPRGQSLRGWRPLDAVLRLFTVYEHTRHNYR
jgi:hypothetical protein